MQIVARMAAALAAAFFLALGLSNSAIADDHDKRKAVLVTGASSGIGRNITERLAADGHFVYAGARKAADLEELDAIDNVKSVRLDVTVDEDIAAAVKMIIAEGRGLYGVVNNAGVALIAPMNEMPEEDIHFTFDVNVLGVYRINKAFTPLLEESGGRTTTIGSISGIISGPGSGTYSMSKFAIEAYTDSLAAELEPVGVHVSVVDPGGFKSKIREKVALHQLGIDDPDAPDLTDEQKAQIQAARERNAQLKEPHEVTDAVVHALFSDNPKNRYMVAPNENTARRTMQALIGKAVEMNGGQVHEFSRDELVAILDEALATQQD